MELIAGDYASFIGYFEDWANGHADIKFFMYGGTPLDGVDQATGCPDFAYPYIWLESPVIKFNSNGGGSYFDIFHVDINFIATAPLDDLAKQRAASAAMFTLMGEFQKKLIADNKGKGILNLEDEMEKNEISRDWAESHYGWRLSLEMVFNANSYLF